MKVILASTSPRRIDLLKTIIENFEVVPSNYDETKTIEKNPKKLVKKLSYMKANEVFQRKKDEEKKLMVIGGDTVVYFNREVVGKPKDKQDAINILTKLQNNRNAVYTGSTVIVKKNNKIKVKTFVTKSIIYIRKMTNKEIVQYVDTGEPMDKAGAYSIQGIGSKFAKIIKGSYVATVGLDMEKILKIIAKNINL